MGKVLIIAMIILAIPWSVQTWWRMRRARGPKERAFMGRTYLAGWMFMALVVLLVTVLKGQAMLFALPIIGVAGLAMQHGFRKARARIQAEEADPLNRARRIN